LPASDAERQLLLGLAAEAKVPALPGRSGRGATVGQLLQDLPHARWAHLATHGFFADPEFRTAVQTNEELFRQGVSGERVGVAARNPLVLSGLVMAGANRPDVGDDKGILTAEAIASLDLSRLELAVLSACQTGLGEVSGDEGVFGLQRAFHLAGARNVIASLWQVEDEATAALMGLFYRKLWLDKKPPLQALREAQLYLYYHPEQIPTLAKKRGVDFANPQELPAEAVKPVRPAEVKPGQRAKTNQWAAFVLSGTGR
jgi:CHAT domain-containing protein